MVPLAWLVLCTALAGAVQGVEARDLGLGLDEVRALQGSARAAGIDALLSARADDHAGRAEVCSELLVLLERSPDAELEAFVGEQHWRALQGTARFDEALECTARWIEAGERARLPLLQGDAHQARGMTLLQSSRLEEADRAVTRALKLFDGQGRPARENNAVSVLGGIAYRRGQYARATELFTRSLRMAESENDVPLQARAWNNLGLVYKQVGSYEQAREALERAYETYAELGNEDRRMGVLGNLGNAYYSLGEYETALEMQRSSLEYDEGSGNPLKVAYGHARIARTLVELERLGEAEEAFRRSLGIRRTLGLPREIARASLDLAQVLLSTGEATEAVALLEEAVEAKGSEPGVLERDLYQSLAEAYSAVGRTEESAWARNKYTELDNELTPADLNEKIAELSTRNELAAEENELHRLRSQQELDRLALEEQRTRNAALVVGCGLLAALSLALIVLARTRSRLTRSLERHNEQLAGTLRELESALVELQASEHTFRRLFEDSSSGRLLLDSEHAVLQVNQVARAWLGAGDPLEGQALDELAPELVLPGKHALRATTVWERLADGGGATHIEVRTSPVTLGGRELTLVTLNDVTTSKLLEEEQRRGQNLASVSLLAAGIAHDFNNALTGILGNVGLARASANLSEVDGLLEGAERATKHAGKLTNQLLTFARGGSPVLKVQELGAQLQRWTSFSCSGSNIDVLIDVAPDLWPARYDENQLAQVINNLSLNAQDSMQGNGRLVVRAENLRISGEDPADLEPGPYVRVSFEDEGPGVDPEVREKVFTPYFSTKDDGRGLGLATSYTILVRHRGLLRLSPQQPDGARFEFLLPASPGSDVDEASSPNSIRPKEGKILVIDDEPMVRFVFTSMLKKIGYTVTSVPDGRAACDAIAQEGAFDLAVIDATIPGRPGGAVALELLREVQPGMRAVLTSGYSDEGELARYRELGFEGLLRKPFDTKQLAEAVNDALASPLSSPTSS
jgi:signal transduction histidine kinase/ActR/RegA family two-component response regulator